MKKLAEARTKINNIDQEMRELFLERLKVVKEIGEIKKECHLPILNSKREEEVIQRNCANADKNASYCTSFFQAIMKTSKHYQYDHFADSLWIHLDTSYEIKIQKDCLKEASDLLDFNRKVLIITDKGIPKVYVNTLRYQCADATVLTLLEGEASKSLKSYEYIMKKLIALGFTRGDCIVALGGGVVCDIAGFCASSFMRGIDLYMIPTTMLAMLDASIGGKNGLNLLEIKNQVGTFYQPKAVLIDPNVLHTLSSRHYQNGMVEGIKMALTFDTELFEQIEADAISTEDFIKCCLAIKKHVVEVDEKEHGLRRVLNFGHTIGHALEVNTPLLHGECVALGMIAMSEGDVRRRLISLFQRMNLKTSLNFSKEQVLETLKHDKKVIGEEVIAIVGQKEGSYDIQKMAFGELMERLNIIWEEEA